jgi:hypothetical protein
MDPIGFAFEHFDPIGRYRDADPLGNPIDATGEFPDGRQFEGLDGLIDVVADDPTFTECAMQKMLIYAVGRDFSTDFCGVYQMTEDWADEGFEFESWVREVAMSPYFRTRRGQLCED